MEGEAWAGATAGAGMGAHAGWAALVEMAVFQPT